MIILVILFSTLLILSNLLILVKLKEDDDSLGNNRNSWLDFSLLIPLDEKDHLNKTRLSLISSLLHNKETKFHVLRVIETENDSFKEADVEVLNSNFSEENYSYFNITNVPLHYVVDTYVQTNTIDFEVFIIQQTTFFERLFARYISNQVLN